MSLRRSYEPVLEKQIYWSSVVSRCPVHQIGHVNLPVLARNLSASDRLKLYHVHSAYSMDVRFIVLRLTMRFQFMLISSLDHLPLNVLQTERNEVNTLKIEDMIFVFYCQCIDTKSFTSFFKWYTVSHYPLTATLLKTSNSLTIFNSVVKWNTKTRQFSIYSIEFVFKSIKLSETHSMCRLKQTLYRKHFWVTIASFLLSLILGLLSSTKPRNNLL